MKIPKVPGVPGVFKVLNSFQVSTRTQIKAISDTPLCSHRLAKAQPAQPTTRHATDALSGEEPK
jgi:hypothetical protein